MTKFLLTLLVLLCGTVNSAATDRYAVPSGGSGSACSSGTPCTLATMLGLLVPGDTGYLKDGTWTGAGTILLLDATSSTGNVVDGTSGSPITLKAENPGLAQMLGDGTSGEVCRLVQLSWWVIEGFRCRNVTNAAYTGSSSSVIYGVNIDNVIIRKMIAKHPNQYGNSHAIHVQGTNNLIEDNDFHEFHRNGLELFGTGTTGNIVRRNYGSQTLPDLSAGGDGPNDFYVAYDAPNNTWENNVAEFSGTGLNGSGFTAWGANNKYYGNVSIGNVNGMTLVSAASVTTGADDYIVHHQVSINPTNYGLYLRSPINANVLGLTVHNSQLPDRGLILNDNDAVANATATIRNAMMINTTGAVATSIDSLTLSHSHEFGAGDPGGATSVWAGGTSGRIDSPPTPPGDVDPAFGGCRVYMPISSPFKGKGFGGADPAANVIYRTIAGVLQAATSVNSLWDFSLTGADRGKLKDGPAVIAGVNDSSTGLVRSTFHQRIGFGNGACPSPITPIFLKLSGAFRLGAGVALKLGDTQ